jgi:hypothetical protein
MTHAILLMWLILGGQVWTGSATFVSAQECEAKKTEWLLRADKLNVSALAVCVTVVRPAPGTSKGGA